MDKWQRRERDCLDRGVCPHSGLMLTLDGDGLPGTLSCGMCDCFGFALSEFSYATALRSRIVLALRSSRSGMHYDMADAVIRELGLMNRGAGEDQ